MVPLTLVLGVVRMGLEACWTVGVGFGDVFRGGMSRGVTCLDVEDGTKVEVDVEGEDEIEGVEGAFGVR